jgi:competence-damaged protein
MTEDVSASELDYVQVDHALVERAIEALDSAKRAGLKVVTAESCTGGLVAMVLSEAPGAAEFLEGGFVTYTPEQKCAALELDPLLIEKHGAVSAEGRRCHGPRRSRMLAGGHCRERHGRRRAGAG